MVRSEAAERHPARAELALLGDPGGGACLVVQRRPCEQWFSVVGFHRSDLAARRWVEAHYQDVLWRSSLVGTALVGKIRP